MALYRNVVILGAGASGLAAARLARTLSESVAILDGGTPDLAALEAEGFVIETGAAAERYPGPVDLVVLSPGIDPRQPIVTQFSRRGIPVIGEIELASRHFDRPIIAITGTNGKTTTTELITRIFAHVGKEAPSAGNYGVPFSEVALREPPPDVVALEVSSFQLESIESFRPDVSVFLNLAPDHLDRYDDFEAYRDAKMRIFKNQNDESGLAVIQAPELHRLEGRPMRKVSFSAFGEGTYTLDRGTMTIRRDGVDQLRMGQTRLRGTHNAENVMAALAVAAEFGIGPDVVADALADYQPPAHRSELVGTWVGHEFINDSKATNLHALESSLLGQVEPVILIAGGKDKGLDFSSLRDLAGERVTHAVLLGEIAECIAAAWSGAVPCTVVGSLEEAVEESVRRARPKQVVLFSPGTSSFDMFRGYEARGDAFKALVSQL